ncbi:hypothetical protein ACWDKQ_08560 [Saccharopolyspora sp. NPDC000995]
MRTHIAPVTLGAGERLFDGVPALGLGLVSARPASLVTHVTGSAAEPAAGSTEHESAPPGNRIR